MTLKKHNIISRKHLVSIGRETPVAILSKHTHTFVELKELKLIKNLQR